MDTPIVTQPPQLSFTRLLKQQAAQLGFVLCGATPAAKPQRLEALRNWLDAGYAGQMNYIPRRLAAYEHPQHVLNGCKSVLMLAMPYQSEATQNQAPPLRTGRIARYAQANSDYHDVIHLKLKDLCHWITSIDPTAAVRGVVDTAPLLEREMAETAGLGWVGKNTLLLNRQWGSYFFLAALLTDLELEYDPPTEKGYCGTCRACLDACPTDAFVEPFVLDATQCISYLTIEHKGSIDNHLKDRLNGWVFGCDVCQEVCPWNRKPDKSSEGSIAPREDLASFDVLAALQLTDAQFRHQFRRTALWRSKRRGLLRNALLVAGHARMAEAFTEICRLLSDQEPLVRAAAAWALGQFDSPESAARLIERQLVEQEADVLSTLKSALSRRTADKP